LLQWARWIERQKYGADLNDVAWVKNRICNLTNSTADRLFAMAVIVDEDTASNPGRPKSLSATATEAIRQLFDDEAFTKTAMAKKLWLSRASIHRALRSLKSHP
jgi:response regulator of citrate/malate metabolism